MEIARRRSLRRIAAGCAAVLALTTVPPLAGVAGAADPLPEVASPLPDGAFCDGAPDANPFTDLRRESPTTLDVILCLVATELTEGSSATTFSPGGNVTRRQMALFVKRLADLFDGLEVADLQALPAYDGEPDFSDQAAEDDDVEAAIGQLVQAEIVGGYPDGEFKPDALVSRRQMAAFVNRLQEFLTGTPFTAEGDHFDDDEGDSGEADLNAVAAVGIFQGDGAGSAFPGQHLTRRQMALMLLRDAQVQYAGDAITSPFPQGNESLSFTPDAPRTIIDAEGSSSATGPDTSDADNVTFTATGLGAGAYRVTLVESANITMRGNERVFAEDGDTGFADPGDVGARIVAVNGEALPTPTQSIGGLTATEGQVSVTVDGYRYGSATPLIYADGGASTRLELDDTNEPLEAFGLAAPLTTLPSEAPAGSFTVVVLAALPDGDAFVGQQGEDQHTFLYDSNDTFRDGPIPLLQSITYEGFEARLTAGDGVTVTYAPDPAASSTMQLSDSA